MVRSERATVKSLASSSIKTLETALYIRLADDGDDASFGQTPTRRWIPALRSPEAVDRHVAFAKIYGEELAVWRDDRGFVNAWENRCPHRGVRLSIGTNTGQELVCRYHGWRFGTSDAKCRKIPAHPNQTPPKTARVRQYECYEKYGFIWVHFGEVTGEPRLDIDGSHLDSMRSIQVAVSASAVNARLKRATCVRSQDARPAADGLTLLPLIVPVDAETCVVHGILKGELPEGQRVAVLRAVNQKMKELCKAVSSPPSIDLPL